MPAIGKLEAVQLADKVGPGCPAVRIRDAAVGIRRGDADADMVRPPRPM